MTLMQLRTLEHRVSTWIAFMAGDLQISLISMIKVRDEEPLTRVLQSAFQEKIVATFRDYLPIILLLLVTNVECAP